MSIKDDYYIAPVDNKTANDVVQRCHYAHRRASAVRSFGLFSKSPNRLVGVVIYGISASHSVEKSICGEEESRNVYELTRLYVDDGLPKNLESYLVGNTLKLLDKELIISYSDTACNHIGVVYQATNFLYTGLSHGSIDFEEIDENGNRLHNKYMFVKYGGAENIRNAMNHNPNIKMIERSRKHRYIYINAKGKRKKELLQKLQYEVLPYPKQSCSVPITSTENIHDTKSTGRRLF